MLKIAAFCVAVLFTSEVSSCHTGRIWSFYDPSTVSLSAVGSYLCYGNGSYLYWFIDGVNSENISSEELATKGISFGGSYNHYPPYNQSCLFMHSFLYIAGNCLNNNTEIQCMILGSAPPYNDTSPARTLTVQGDPVVINDFRVLSATTNSIIVSWDVTPVMNSSLTLTITDSYGTVNSTVNVTGMNNVYVYTEPVLPPSASCNVYTFTLTPQPLLAGCNNISVITAAILALAPQIENLTTSYHYFNDTLVIRFQIHECFKGTVQLLLVGPTGSSITSDPLPIESLNYTDGFYEINWKVKLHKHSLYYLTASALDTYGTTTGVAEINTYNVKDLIITRDRDDLCITCNTTTIPHNNNCQVVIVSTMFLQPLQRNESCYSFTDNGTYIIYAHDIDDNGSVVAVPAIVREYTVDWVIPLVPLTSSTMTMSSPLVSTTYQYTSSIVKGQKSSMNLISVESSFQLSSLFLENSSSSTISLSSQSISNPEIEKKDQSLTIPIFGGLFALSLSCVLILLIILIAMLVHQRRRGKITMNSTLADGNHDSSIITTPNSAYELIQVGNGGQQALTVSDTVNDIHTTRVYNDPELREEIPPPIPLRLYTEDDVIS